MNTYFKVATTHEQKKRAIDISKLKVYIPINILMNSRTLPEKYMEYLEEIILGESSIQSRMGGITELLAMQREIKKKKIIYIKTSNNFIASLTPISVCLNVFFEKHEKVIDGMSQMLYGLHPEKTIDVDPEMLKQLTPNFEGETL